MARRINPRYPILRRALLWPFAIAAAALLCVVGHDPNPSDVGLAFGAQEGGDELPGPDPIELPDSLDAPPAPPWQLPGLQWPPPEGIPGIELPGLVLPPLPAPSPDPGAAPPKTVGELVIDAARSKLGAEYSWGAAGPDAFDCSGLAKWAYEQAGVEIPRTSAEQLAEGTPIPLGELRPGDLVSFYGGTHIGLYAGDGNVIHAGTYATGVSLTSISVMPLAGARRF